VGRKHFPLVVVLRCHQWPMLVLDTVETVFTYCLSMPLVVLSIDNNPAVRLPTLERFPQVEVFCSQQQWGWGSGLYGLLADTIKWVDKQYTYDALVSIDYDTYFIARGIDTLLLERYADTDIGLAGGYVGDSANWRSRYYKSREEVTKILDVPNTYTPGESVLGCFMWLTKQGVQGLREHKFLDDPYRDIRGKIDLADDPWLALLVRCAGFGIESCRDLGYFAWRTSLGYQRFLAKGLRVFHPTKVNRDVPGFAEEIKCRNYFRRLRGRPPLTEKDCYAV